MANATCSIEGCSKRVHTRGWCPMHYQRWRKNGDPLIATLIPPRPARPCEVEGCERRHEAKGLCGLHYTRLRTMGTTDDPVFQHTLTCSVEGCHGQALKRGWCQNHYTKWRLWGTTDGKARDRGTRGTVNGAGYIMFNRPEHPLASRNGLVLEHRMVLLDTIGPGEHPCHWCGKTVTWDKTWPRDLDALVVDHLDGTRSNNDPANLVPSCQPCNTKRVV